MEKYKLKVNTVVKPIDKDDTFNVQKEAYTGSGIVINSNLLNELLNHQYINKRPPKSTGRNEFGINMNITK